MELKVGKYVGKIIFSQQLVIPDCFPDFKLFVRVFTKSRGSGVGKRELNVGKLVGKYLLKVGII